MPAAAAEEGEGEGEVGDNKAPPGDVKAAKFVEDGTGNCIVEWLG